MLTLHGRENQPLCSGLARRDVLRVGALSTLGLGLPDLLRLEAAAAAGGSTSAGWGKAKNVLLIYMGGGQTHHDTFDPKPEAPPEIRGKYGVIPTRVTGVRYSDQMPALAACNHLYTLVRSQVSGSDHHETSAQWMLTGNYGTAQGGDYPSIGAVVTHEMRALNSLPPYVAIPRNHSFTWELGKAAWLGEQYESFKAGDPANSDWRVPNLALQKDVKADRLDRRRGLLQAVDSLARRVQGNDSLRSMDSFYQRAVQMVLSEEARSAFDLSKEPESVRKQYRFDEKDRFGPQCLLARRLLEANVRFVFLGLGGWDMHAKIFESCDRQLRPWDHAVAALLTDMDARGLLKETFVAIYGDFGRTSKINKDAGRDHWANAGSMLFAGAGVRGGQVIGQTDDRGEFVLERPVRPPEVAASLYHALGVDFHRELVTPNGRPVRILSDTQPVTELWS